MSNFKKRRENALRMQKDISQKTQKLCGTLSEIQEHCEKVEKILPDSSENLPDDLKKCLEATYKKARYDLKQRADALNEELQQVQTEADKAIEQLKSDSQKNFQKGDELISLRDIPKIGDFLQAKGHDLYEEGMEMRDILNEMEKYSDKLKEAKRLLNRSSKN